MTPNNIDAEGRPKFPPVRGSSVPDWRVPSMPGGGKSLGADEVAFMASGLSSADFDTHVFGPASNKANPSNEFEAQLFSHEPIIVLFRSGSEVAQRELPDTLEETVAWCRMVQALNQ